MNSFSDILTPFIVFAAACLAGCAAPDRPNVIVVITDDQGYGDLGVHGHPLIHTPNLDRLHSESVRLTDFHVDPTCSPTRAALLSGHYSTRTGGWHTIMGRSLMDPREVTLAEIFRDAGYRTGMVGKWHLGDNYSLRPHDQGFEEAFWHPAGGVGQGPDFFGNDYFDDRYLRNGTLDSTRGYVTDVCFDNALDVIERHRSEPFFLYLATDAPHGPYFVEERYSKPYADWGVNDMMARFLGMITNIDDNMGRLLSHRDDMQLADNTIVVFMTDNGSAEGWANWRQEPGDFEGYNAGMRAGKGSKYDGGHRVPFFVRWPAGELPAGQDVPALTAHIDVLPTLAELAGLSAWEEVAIDGLSLAPVMRREAEAGARTLFVHPQRLRLPIKWRKSSVMTERWRLVNKTELYDIGSDPAQQFDAATSHPDIVRETADRVRIVVGRPV